jgi:hypothetical protein
MNLLASIFNQRIRMTIAGTFIICLWCLVGCQPTTARRAPLEQSALNRQDFQKVYERDELTELDQAGKLCSNSGALECYEGAYFSKDYLDVFKIQLERYPDEDTAVKNQSMLLTILLTDGDIETPLTPYLSNKDHRWLGSTHFADGEWFLGGAIKSEVAVRIEWLRNTGTVSVADAVEGFSRLIDAQMARLE